MWNVAKQIVVFTVTALIVGCAAPSRPRPEDPYAYQPPPGSRTEGSLWITDPFGFSWFEAKRANKVGDIVTVRIIERSRAVNTADTKAERKSSVEGAAAGFTASVSGFKLTPPTFSGSGNSKFEGKGSTTQQGTLTAEVPAVVTLVYPNGNMVIDGKRDVLINRERQLITVSGVIRPEDVDVNNIVFSNVISDAKIGYSGKGVLGDIQGPGWLTRVISWIWPF